MFSNMFFYVLIIICSFFIPPSFASSCNHVCKGNKVRYPFGFSDGCKIRLRCNDTTGNILINKHRVVNITLDHMLVNFPAKCYRPYERIRQLRTENYALTRRNSLLLRNCSGTLSGCLVTTDVIKGQFHLPRCESMNRGNISCYSNDDSGGDNEFMDMVGLEMAGCRGLYSSVVVDDIGGKSSVVSLGVERVELGWWVEGECDCHKNAVCKNVSIDGGRAGFRCYCGEGYDGDGFAEGDGCHRVTNCNPSKYMNGKCGGTTRVAILIGGIIAGASLVAAIALTCYCLRKRRILRNQSSARRLLSEATGSINIPSYSYKEIERATNNFSTKQMLGTGAYGTVYSGKLNNHDWVAIKKIRHIETYGMDQVMNEIKLLSSVSHPNLVRLLGFCIEKGEQILVYEFMPNGTLSQHLQKEIGKGLAWTTRVNIASQTAQAIAYLHSAMIYHRDVKSSNILLDYSFNSKVADFGLSRLGMPDESHISTAPQGTPGYVDPEYHQNFHLSDKSDVYSFGVVLVEIITALKVVDLSRRNSEVNLAALAIDKIGNGRVDELIDPSLDPHRDAWTLPSIHKVAELAFRCLAFHGDMRPSMTEVADELEQIRLSGWAPSDGNVTKGSLSVISSSSPNGIEKEKVESRRLAVPQILSDCLTKGKENDTSTVLVQEGLLHEHSSPSSNSLLSNIVRVECKTCGKYGWSGCGQHLKQLYGGIEKGKHCMCRSWPGVVIPAFEKASDSTNTTTAATDTTTTTTTSVTASG